MMKNTEIKQLNHPYQSTLDFENFLIRNKVLKYNKKKFPTQAELHFSQFFLSDALGVAKRRRRLKI